MYLIVSTRPDLAFAVGRLSQYSSVPNKQYGKAAKYVLRYLESTKNRGLVLGGAGKPELIGYSDSD